MRNVKPTVLLSLFVLAACPADDTTLDELPATGGFLELECPGGYLCPPDQGGVCAHANMEVAPSGLCSFRCMETEDCPLLIRGGRASTVGCIAEFMCGSTCETDADCVAYGYEEPTHCWDVNSDGELRVCADPTYEATMPPMADGGSSAG